MVGNDWVPENSIWYHLLLNTSWDQDKFDLVVSKGDLLDLPSMNGMTPLTRVLVERKQPDSQKWNQLVSYGATSLSWDRILLRMFKDGDLSILKVISDSFPKIKIPKFSMELACICANANHPSTADYFVLVLDHLKTFHFLGFETAELASSISNFLLIPNQSEEWYCDLLKWSHCNGVDTLNIPYRGHRSTILHWAAQHGFLTIVQFLDSIGADWNREDYAARNPYMTANLEAVVKFLRPKTNKRKSFSAQTGLNPKALFDSIQSKRERRPKDEDSE